MAVPDESHSLWHEVQSVKVVLNSSSLGMAWRIFSQVPLKVAGLEVPGCPLGMGPLCLFSAAAR